jgi:type I restriction enzyme S subunit
MVSNRLKNFTSYGSNQTGYQKTPKGWQEGTFGDYLELCSSGATPYRRNPEFYKGEIPWVSSGELNYNLIDDTLEKISDLAVQKTNLKVHPAGTILIAITGLEAAGTRGSCGILGIPSTTNQSCMALYPNKKLKVGFLYHYYVYKGDELAFKYCQGTKQQSYTAKLVKILPIIVPDSLDEQTAIANALSDIDNSINSLEKLIAKKQAIKIGAMQQLLTGQKRLPPFDQNHTGYKQTELGKIPKDWIVKAMHKVGKFGRGRVISHKEILNSTANLYPVYSSQTSNMGIMGYLDSYDFDGEYITWTTDGVNAGKVFYRNGKFNCTNVCGVIKVKKGWPQLIAYSMDRVARSYVSTNLANPKLMNRVAKKVQIALPKDLDEQILIASTIDEISQDLEINKKKLNKLKSIRKGMMQELLSGRTRLI